MNLEQNQKNLTRGELAAQEEYLSSLRIPKRKTKKPVIVAMVGLVGSGKSSVARELAKAIGAVVLDGDGMRVALRKHGQGYDNVRTLADNVCSEILALGSSIIRDSDFGDREKMGGARREARVAGAKIFFVRTHCDPDILIGRIMAAKYTTSPDDFFGGASTSWGERGASIGAVVKMREMWRRTPHHYTWSRESGGSWRLRRMGGLLADIDTSSEAHWKTEVAVCAKRLLDGGSV